MHFIFLLLLFPVGLTAQLTDAQKNSGKGWYLTLRLEPELLRKERITPYVTAADTLPFDTSTGNNRFSRYFRGSDTIRFNGNETIYYGEPELSTIARRQDAFFRLLTALKFNYQYRSGMELSVGGFYDRYVSGGKVDIPDNFPTDFFYITQPAEITTYGITTDVAYVFRRSKRLRPFVALLFQWGIRKYELLDNLRIFPAERREESRLSSVREQFREQYIFDLDLDIVAGAQYQITDRLYVGIEIPLRQAYLPDWPNALQFRYRLSRPVTAP